MPDLPTRQCQRPGCLNTFKPYRKTSYYCSNGCRSLSGYHRAKGHHGKPALCANCGNPFASLSRDDSYCCAACAQVGRANANEKALIKRTIAYLRQTDWTVFQAVTDPALLHAERGPQTVKVWCREWGSPEGALTVTCPNAINPEVPLSWLPHSPNQDLY